jgi:hypothetical protein
MISDIYDAVAGLSVGTVSVRNITSAKNTVKAGDCPVRILLPVVEGEQGFIAIGKNNLMSCTWLVRDVCLWSPLQEGAGIEQHATDMVGYIENYATALKSFRAPTNASHLVNVSFSMKPILWGETSYLAIETILEIEEFI